MHSIVTTFRGADIKVEVANFCAAMEVANFCAAVDTLIDQDDILIAKWGSLMWLPCLQFVANRPIKPLDRCQMSVCLLQSVVGLDLLGLESYIYRSFPMIKILYRLFMAGILDIDSGTEICIFAIGQPISVHDLGHVFSPAAGWSMCRSPRITEVRVNVYDFGQGYSGTFGKQIISKHFHNLNVRSSLWHDMSKFST